MKKNAFCVAVSLSILVSIANGVEPSFQGLGDFTGGDFWSGANGISGDGSTVVGYGIGATGQRSSYWRDGEGMVDFTGRSSTAYKASTDGSVIMGGYSPTGTSLGYIWSKETGMVSLGSLSGGQYSSYAEDLSADGSIVVGRSSSSNYTKAFKWTASTGMVQLPDHPDHTSSETAAYGISAEGSVIAGRIVNGGGACIWKDGNPPQLLDPVTAPYAWDISGDGSTVIGSTSQWYEPEQAIFWTESKGILKLGNLTPGGYSKPWACSYDGSVIVGHAEVQSGLQEAFIWEEQYGMLNIKDLLSAQGLDLTGWRLDTATGVSDDGMTIAGIGINPNGYREAWIASIPEPTTITLLAIGAVLARRRRK